MKVPFFLYSWIDDRDRIPWLVQKIWPKLHFCYELDGALLEEVEDFCHCFEEEN